MLTILCRPLRPGARLPTKAHPDDAGWDCYLPEDAVIDRSGTLLPLGLAVAVPPGSCWVLKDRSGVAARLGLRVAAGVIDAGYRGEVCVLVDVAPPRLRLRLALGRLLRRLLPARWAPAWGVRLRAGDRVCQALLVPVPEAEVVAADELPPPGRAGGFGSTGR